MHSDRLVLGRALNGRGRTCDAGNAAMHGADEFATSPALLQSTTFGVEMRCHKTLGLRPGLTPAGRWPTVRDLRAAGAQ